MLSVITAPSLRRECRAILRHDEIPCDAGDCMIASVNLAHRLLKRGIVRDATVRSGSIALGPDAVMSHAWIEATTHDGRTWSIDPTAHQLGTHALKISELNRNR